MNEDDLVDVGLRACALFDELDIPYYITGAVASVVYGQIRTTQNVDLIASIEPNHIDVIVRELQELFFIDPAKAAGAVNHRSMFDILHHSSIYKVNIIVPQSSEAESMRLQRRIRHIVKENPLHMADFVSAEDLVLSNLEWYRLGRGISDQVWMDILGVIQIQSPRLDRDYLNQWAATLNLTDLLTRAYRDAEV
jgi:hypothetical protein